MVAAGLPDGYADMSVVGTILAIPSIDMQTTVREAGEGSPVLYLHGIWDGQWNDFTDRLARVHRVMAPAHPGFTGASPGSGLLDVHDLVYYYLDYLDAAGLRDVALVGHSLGGMIAAELAAVQPARFRKLVLISPLGLWNAQDPVLDFFAARPDEVAAAVTVRTEGALVRSFQPLAASGEEELIQLTLERARSLASAARFLWPIPNRGLVKRLHRVRAPTLVLWGDRDGISPPSYAERFASLIPGARVQIVQGAAHLLHLDQPETSAAAVSAFLT